MAELTFAKQFLTLLDARPSKLSSDHTADARTLPAQSATILPRNTHPFPAASLPASPSHSQSPSTSTAKVAPSLTLTLTALRPSPSLPTPLTLARLPASSTTMHDVKTALGRATGYAPAQMKLLWRRKPVGGDARRVWDVIGGLEDDTEGKDEGVEMQVMFVGAPAGVPEKAGEKEVQEKQEVEVKEEEKDKQGVWGLIQAGLARETDADAGPLGDVGFWRDLEGWVGQRVRLPGPDVEEVLEAFWKGWAGRERERERRG